ncbi:MAG: response regulator [Ruminiclostridium sp.]|nr:response regulator [Ruminiclostridium sp.]
MASSILIISSGAAFMTDALKTSLVKTGMNVTGAEPYVDSVEKQRETADIILFFAGEFVYKTSDILVYLKDICEADEKPLCVIGYEKELDVVRGVIPKHLIKHEFTRPFNVKILTAELGKLAEKNEEFKKGRHILLVDDDVTFLRMMQDWLAMKYRITSVKSGMQAITYIATHTPDLILLDYEMPITPGSQIMEMIRSEPNSARIPVIFLTGKDDRETVMKVMHLKPDGYLLKSMTHEEIVTAIDNFFETRKWKNIKL